MIRQLAVSSPRSGRSTPIEDRQKFSLIAGKRLRESIEFTFGLTFFFFFFPSQKKREVVSWELRIIYDL